MHAHRGELMLPGVGDCCVLAVGQHDGRPICRQQGEKLQAGLEALDLREQRQRLFRLDGPDIRDRAFAEMGELVGGQVAGT